MAREIQIVQWCDVCIRDSERTPATISEVVRFGAGQVRQIDLCEQHGEPLAQVRQLVEEYGTQPDDIPVATNGARQPARDGSLECPLCQHLYKSLGSLGAHLRHQHQTTRSELGLTERTGYDRQLPPCEVCGFTTWSPQGISAHRRIAHGLDKR